MNEPELVYDLFCGAGGASWGLHQAWPNAKIVGVDIMNQPRWPLRYGGGGRFIQADVIELLSSTPLPLPDFIWASPPCQGYSYTRHIKGHVDTLARYPRVIAKVRKLITTNFPGVPYCIENVENSPLINHTVLCGTMFPTSTPNIFRHRWFECNFPVVQPLHPEHPNRLGTPHSLVTVVGHAFSKADGAKAMGINWMSRDELAEAVPPVYAKYIAQQLQIGKVYG